MAVLVLCLFAALAAGLIGIYARLAPLQALQDKRTARQGMHEGSGKAGATEREDLFKGLRSQIKELTETLYLERGIANERQGQLEAGRAAFHSLVAQLNEERLVLEGICLEINVERVDLQDTLYRALGPERVNRAVEQIQARRARGESASAQGVKPDARAEEEVTKPEGLPTHLVNADDAEAGDNDPTLSLSRNDLDKALGAGAGGTTRKQDGMGHSLHTRGGNAPRGAAPRATTLPSMPAQSMAPTASPSDTPTPPPEPDDHSATFESLPRFDPEQPTSGGEAPTIPALEPPLYAPRGRARGEAGHGLS